MRMRSRRAVSRLVGSLAMVLVASLAAVAVLTGTAANAGAATWRVAATLGLGTPTPGVSCPSTTQCWGIEAGELLESGNGGSSWTVANPQLPADVSAADGVSCPATNWCYVTATLTDGNAAIVDLHAGQATQHDLPSLRLAPQVACITAVVCLATDGTTVLHTSNSWDTLTTTTLAHPVDGNPSLACHLGSYRCWMVGDNGETPVIEATRSGGAQWATQTSPSSIDGVYGISCPTLTYCMAVGSDTNGNATAIATTNAGIDWQSVYLPTSVASPLVSAACTSPGVCLVGAGAAGYPRVESTTNGGSTWSARTLPGAAGGGSPAYVSCPAGGSSCVTVSAGLGFTSTDGGSTWAAVTLPSAPGAPSGLACPSASQCVGVGNDASGRPEALTSTNGGTVWTRGTMPAAAGMLGDVSCPSTADCYAVALVEPAFRAQALSSTNGGASWRLDRVVSPSGWLRHLTCPTTSTCLAGGGAQTLALTTNGGAAWEPVTPPAAVNMIEAVSCSARTACVLVGQASDGTSTAYTTADLGADWTAHPMPLTDLIDGLSCVAKTCIAVGDASFSGAILASTDGGLTWSAQVMPNASSTLPSDVRCATASDCAVTAEDFAENSGATIDGTTNGGTIWTAFPVPAGNESPLGLACVATTCLAADNSASSNPLILTGPL